MGRAQRFGEAAMLTNGQTKKVTSPVAALGAGPRRA
jgi:hypothetical protein